MMTVGGGIFALRRPRPCSRAYAGMQMRHAAKASRLPMTECHYAQVFNPLNAWLKTIYRKKAPYKSLNPYGTEVSRLENGGLNHIRPFPRRT